VEEIELTFSGEDDCAGTFVRRTYRNGVLQRSRVGTFGPG
jgi:hypothetical protein